MEVLCTVCSQTPRESRIKDFLIGNLSGKKDGSVVQMIKNRVFLVTAWKGWKNGRGYGIENYQL